MNHDPCSEDRVACDTCKTVHPWPTCRREPHAIAVIVPDWLHDAFHARAARHGMTASAALREILIREVGAP